MRLGWLRSPALHMLALGAALFGVARMRGGAFFPHKPRIEIAAHRFQQMHRDFVDQSGREPTAEEWQQIRDTQIDDEVLFQYALTLGMQENTAARARLSQIAEFVEANPEESTSPEERAKIAMKLGLHEGDLIVRRILTDSARRLIRAVVLLQKPRPELVEQFFAANPEEYVHPAQIRLSQIAVNGFKWPDTETRARALRARIEKEKLDFAAALALGDESPVPVSLPLEPERGLEVQLGRDFAAAVMTLPIGEWSGPIASRYGHHLVFVHERKEARLPPLAEVEERVEQQLLEKLADDWLKLRLKELRAEYEIVEPGSAS